MRTLQKQSGQKPLRLLALALLKGLNSGKSSASMKDGIIGMQKEISSEPL